MMSQLVSALSQLLPYLLILAAGAVIFYFVWKIKSGADVEDGSPMPSGSRRILTGYLLVFGTFLVYMLVSLNSLDFPETAAIPDQVAIPSASPSPPPTASPAPSPPPSASPAPSPSPTASTATPAETPALFRVFPQTSVSSPPTVSLTMYGRNFKEESQVRFNSKKAGKLLISDNLIEAQLQPDHLVNVGSVTVEVENPGGLLSNAIRVPVRRPTVPLNVFGWHPWITREVQLLLLVIFAGALGSYLHALKSLGDFIGNRTLTASWFWWYVTRPFLGMAMALVFYAVLRGGFLAGSPADAKVVNPFGVLAIGALVGMFADKAAQKLGEVFDVVFKAGDPRGGKLDAAVIDRLEPGTVPAGETKPVAIKIIGDRLGKVSTVRVNADDRKPDNVSEKEVTFTLKPEDMKTSGKIRVSAVNPDGGVSAAATLHVSDLEISGAALTDARADIDYQQQITAAGGAGSNKWALANSPKWLSIDDKGMLKGKPGTADVKEIKVTVKVVDKEGASRSKEFDLKVVP